MERLIVIGTFIGFILFGGFSGCGNDEVSMKTEILQQDVAAAPAMNSEREIVPVNYFLQRNDFYYNILKDPQDYILEVSVKSRSRLGDRWSELARQVEVRVFDQENNIYIEYPIHVSKSSQAKIFGGSTELPYKNGDTVYLTDDEGVLSFTAYSEETGFIDLSIGGKVYRVELGS